MQIISFKSNIFSFFQVSQRTNKKTIQINPISKVEQNVIKCVETFLIVFFVFRRSVANLIKHLRS